MHTLTRNVIWATGLHRETAKLAIAWTLRHLLKHVPEVRTAEFLNQLPQAKIVVESLEDDGVLDRLKKLGLTREQILAVFDAVCARAKQLVPDEADKIKCALDAVVAQCPRMPNEIDCPHEDRQGACPPETSQAPPVEETEPEPPVMDKQTVKKILECLVRRDMHDEHSIMMTIMFLRRYGADLKRWLPRNTSDPDFHDYEKFCLKVSHDTTLSVMAIQMMMHIIADECYQG